jgi:hypothetical protein
VLVRLLLLPLLPLLLVVVAVSSKNSEALSSMSTFTISTVNQFIICSAMLKTAAAAAIVRNKLSHICAFVYLLHHSA